VSTLGGFGNEEQMKRINGEANIIAVNAAKEYGKYHVIPYDNEMPICMQLRSILAI